MLTGERSGSAPEGLRAGPDLRAFVGGTLLALVAGCFADPRVLLSEEAALRLAGAAAAPSPTEAGLAAARGDADGAPTEAQVEADASPACVRCGERTAWLEKVGRQRCLACGLYQPLHPPGSQVDAS